MTLELTTSAPRVMISQPDWQPSTEQWRRDFATAEWVDWFNHRRLYRHDGDRPSVEMEELHYADLVAQQPAALPV